VRIPFPDLPSLPSLPSIPWPDLPSIPFPSFSLPAWVGTVLDAAKYVVPVVVAFVIARGEIRRRRREQERRTHAPTQDDEESGTKEA
jgi:flagellar biosynthesis/type III secretory pathway M-ring protein FliF/YscJ